MPNARAGSFQANAWLQITPADEVIFQLDKTEMGQGVMTALPTILAEELEIDPRRIVIELAPVNKAFQNPIQITGGSSSVSSRWDVLRTTGAQAREMLVAAAAARWAVNAGTMQSRQRTRAARRNRRVVQLRRTRQRRSEAAGTEETGIERSRPISSTSASRCAASTAPEKSNGTAVYGIDVDVPDAVVAILIRNPHFGGSLQSFDATAARSAPGVIDIFDVNGAIAVVADTYWHATKAARAVNVTWDKGPLGSLDSDGIRAAWVEMAKEDGRTIRDDGDTDGRAERRGVGARRRVRGAVSRARHDGTAEHDCVVSATVRARSGRRTRGRTFRRHSRQTRSESRAIKSPCTPR